MSRFRFVVLNSAGRVVFAAPDRHSCESWVRLMSRYNVRGFDVCDVSNVPAARLARGAA